MPAEVVEQPPTAVELMPADPTNNTEAQQPVRPPLAYFHFIKPHIVHWQTSLTDGSMTEI